MAAADCARSQDLTTDDSMPIEMQNLKDTLDKAMKKTLAKGDTW